MGYALMGLALRHLGKGGRFVFVSVQAHEHSAVVTSKNANTVKFKRRAHFNFTSVK